MVPPQGLDPPLNKRLREPSSDSIPGLDGFRRGCLRAFVLAMLAAGAGTGCETEVATPGRVAFRDVTLEAGIRIPEDVWGTFGAAWADYDDDGHVDAFVSRHSSRPFLLHNRGDGTFDDVTRAAGLEAGWDVRELVPLDRHGCAWGDAQGDGLPDLYCSTGAEGGKGGTPNQLFLNDGKGAFLEAAAERGVLDVAGRGRAVQWIDYDRDGVLDLHVANTKRSGHPALLFRGLGDGSFRDATAEAGLGDEVEMLGGGAAWCDLDGDGFADLVLAAFGGLVVHRNLGNGTFSADTAADSRIPRTPVRSVACADTNSDGKPELLVGTPEGPAVFLQNLGDGTFRDATTAAGLAAGRVMGAAFADFDNDGHVDVFVVRGYDPSAKRNLPDALFLGNGDGTFVDVAASAGVLGPSAGGGDSAAVADADGDGFLDLLVTDGACQPDRPDGPMFAPIPAEWFPPGGITSYAPAPHGAVTLLRNQRNANHWLELRVLGGRRGDGRRATGHGARVSIRAGGRVQVATVGDGGANYGQSDRTLHFGLGLATKVDEVVVDWTDGSRRVLRDLDADRRLDVAPGEPR